MKISTNRIRNSVLAIAACAMATPAFAQAESAGREGRVPQFGIARVTLDGFQEAPQAVFTDGIATVRLVRRRDRINYELRYASLTGDITVAAGVHIHFGRPALTGGITAFLCEAAGIPAPTPTPACTSDAGGPVTIRGVISPSDVNALPAQGFPGGSIDALWEIIINGAAYVNLHTDAFPAGEIRGDIPGRR